MKVVSNASPLINLACVGQLDLLPHIFDQLLIPDAVWQEVVIEGVGQPGAIEIQHSNWISRKTVSNLQLVQSLRQELDPGEAEAIALAIEIGADLLLMDERLGRQTARYFGLNHIGVIGILKLAKRKGYIVAIRPILDQLRDLAGFRISPSLYEQSIRDVDEL